MTPPIEALLTERLRRAAQTLVPPAELPDDIVAAAATLKRRLDRSRSATFIVLAACVAAALVVGMSVLSGRLQTAPPASQPTPTPTVSPTPDQLTKWEKRAERRAERKEDKELQRLANEVNYRWAKDLPRGEGARVVFTHNGYLYAGDQRIQLPATYKVDGYPYAPSVSAVLPGGWVVNAPAADNPTDSTTGVLSPDGTFTPFAHQYTGRSDRGCVALSPDQTQLILGADIVSLPTGTLIGEIPSNSGYCLTWTSSGLVYPDGRGDFWVWSGSGKPQSLPYEGWTIRSDGYDLDYSKGCTRVVRLQPSAEMETVEELCGIRASRLSPDADRVLTYDYQIYDVKEQRLLADLDVPDELHGGIDTPVWEDANSVVFNVTNWNWYREDGKILYDGFIVRCQINTGQCERASQEFSTRNGVPQTVLPLDVNDPYIGP